MKISATDAKNRLGQVLDEAQRAPVFIEKGGRRHCVVISSERYEHLLKVESRESMALRRRRFNERYKEWLAAQQQQFDAQGLWNDGLQVW
jgi:prevent-host-death family protein